MGNKVDKATERMVNSTSAEAWCRQNNNMPYFETSAKDNISVDEAFLTMIKKALENQTTDELAMPDTIGGMGGKITLDKRKSS